ncbi:hypothetical protein [Tenuibacillus multivorans]|uniref:hypothetical protein n=1 Tax=Tenuibacillus multivorans TaxID=237069 RepID=UPI000B849FF5|nr:hypothetical protein [Tenuibacillus multivorans]GEL78040.1 hypothetical protein TMU01_22750 [Tenuibacillus multivorans]
MNDLRKGVQIPQTWNCALFYVLVRCFVQRIFFNTPVELRKTPIESQHTPIESEKTPIEIRDTPIGSEDTPIEGKVTLIENRDTPIDRRKAIRYSPFDVKLKPLQQSKYDKIDEKSISEEI